MPGMATFDMDSPVLGAADNLNIGDCNVTASDSLQPEELGEENLGAVYSGNAVALIPGDTTTAPVVNGQVIDGEYWRRMHNGTNDRLAPSSYARHFML